MLECTDAYWPLVLCYANGDILPEDAEAWARFDTRCSERARSEGMKFVSLTATGTRVAVDAATRKRLSAHLNGRSKSEAECRAAVHMVMQNAMIRGIVKALSWLSTNKSTDRIQPHESLRAAIEAARRDLPGADVDWPAVQRWYTKLERA